MKNWNWYRLFALALWLSFAAAPVQGQTLRVGCFLSEPNMFEDSHGVSGVVVDYSRAIFQRMGVFRVEYHLYPLARLLILLEQGDVDAALVLVRTPERERLYSVPEAPLYVTQPGLVVLRTLPLSNIERPEDILGLTIGYTGGASLSPFLQSAKIGLSLLFQLEAGEAQIRQLANGRIDAIYTPSITTMDYYVKRYGDERAMKILPLPDAPQGRYIMFSKKAGAKYLGAYERAQAAQLRAESLESFSEKWLRGAKLP